MNAVPTVVALGDSKAIAGFELVRRTVTPPCAVALSVPLVPLIKPAPTVDGLMLIDGALTVTVVCDVVCVRKPGMVAETTVVPAENGRNAKPPFATEEGVCAVFCTISVVPVPPTVAGLTI